MTGNLIGDPGTIKAAKPKDDNTDDERQELLDLPPIEKSSKCTSVRRFFKKWPFVPQRIMICFFAHLGFAIIYMLRGNLSVAIISMTANYTKFDEDLGKLINTKDFDWDLKEQGIILSAFFYGYIVTQIPGGYLAACYGGRRVFGIGVAGAALVTLVTPFCAYRGISVLLFARFICGLFEGVTYPSIHAMWSHWAPPSERSRLATVAFSGAYFGTCLCMVNGAMLSQVFGWESIFYIYGLFALAWCVLWSLWGGETPQGDPMISKEERDYILESIGPHRKYREVVEVPWRDIVLSPQVWAINLCHFAANWGFYTLLTELPTYLVDALNFSLMDVSGAAGIPFFCMGVSTILGGFFADVLLQKRMSVTSSRKVIISTTFLLQMMLFFIVGKTETPGKVLVCFIGILTAAGVSWAGFSVNHLDIAPDFASILLGISNMVATVPGLLSPIITGHIVDRKDDVGSWSVIFLIAGYLYLIAAVIYVLLGSGERQSWANASERTRLSAAAAECASIAVANNETESD